MDEFVRTTPTRVQGPIPPRSLAHGRPRGLTRLGLKADCLVLAAVLTVSLSSCMVGPNYTTPKAQTADQWSPGPSSTSQPAGAAEAFWWKRLNDPVLDKLIDTAAHGNLSLQAAGVRVLQARAQLNKTIGELFPQQQGLSGQFNYDRLNATTTILPGMTRNLETAQTLFVATWEVDFWGKFRRGIESDQAAFVGSVASYDDAMVTLIADTAATYVNIRTLEERLRVAGQNVEQEKEGLRIATAQFKAGATGERDVQQAATQLAQTQAQIPQLEQSLRQAKDALAVLLGQTPDKMDAQLTGPGHIPTPPAGIAVGIPRDLLRRRPDVRAAGLSAASQSALIGVAESQRYPAFTLSGDFGYMANNQDKDSLGDIFRWSNRSLDGGAGFFFPILNYGRLVSQVQIQDAQFQQSVLNYQNTVLVAQREVEDGLAAFRYQQQAVVLLARAVASARRSTELAMVQYKGGQTDYTTVLSAEQAELAVEDSLASAQGNVVQGVISIYRALGGGWEIRDGHDVISQEIKDEMARRSDWGGMMAMSRHLPSAQAGSQPAAAKTGQ